MNIVKFYSKKRTQLNKNLKRDRFFLNDQNMTKFVPGIHLHMVGVEKENCGREQSNIKILDINLDLFRICIH